MTTDEENKLEPEEESLSYHCKNCGGKIDSWTAENNKGFCDICIPPYEL